VACTDEEDITSGGAGNSNGNNQILSIKLVEQSSLSGSLLPSQVSFLETLNF
jgi:hypothetical protein